MDEIVNMQPGERVLYSTQPHWVIFLMPLGIVLFGALVLAIHPLFFYPSMMVIGVGLVGCLLTYISYQFTRFEVTNLRYIRRYGFISRSTSTLILTRIESVDVIQGVAGRLLGFGKIVITGIGGSHDVVLNVPRPFHFRAQLQAAMHKVRS